MVGATLFDLDGLLVDSRAAIAGSMNHALAALGLAPRAAEELHVYIGPPLLETFELLLRDVGGDAARARECLEVYRTHYADHCTRDTPLHDGIADVLAALHGRTRLAVATSKFAAFARGILEALGVAPLFDAIVGPGLDALEEDKVVTVGRALAAVGTADAAMIGDRHFDIAAARHHGIVAIGATWGIGSRWELVEAGADHVVDHPAELVALLEALGDGRR
jgi:phosphoglycolate phosphatase